VPLSPLLTGYDHVLLDLDGCVWVGGRPTPRAAEAVAALRAAGIGVAYVTNDARHATEEFVRMLWQAGLQASTREVVTVGGALQHLLSEQYAGAAAVVIGAPAIHRHVTDAGLRIVNRTDLVPRARVVVAAGHEDFAYPELLDATRALLHGATLVGAARDALYPQPDGMYPGSGAILAAVETAADVTAQTVVGKPSAGLLRTALDRLAAPPDARVLMVGDRLDADLGAALAAGVDGAIVLTGVTTAEQARTADPAPVAVADCLGDLVLGPARTPGRAA
jgi:glycerol 3-phosphatase-2